MICGLIKHIIILIVLNEKEKKLTYDSLVALLRPYTDELNIRKIDNYGLVYSG